ncbi:MAG: hypothetical protein EOM21_18300 [Gammaproteobacteria bacterium]|nr:hypothetical protein [Gammaproteobacteria bacterium]
MVDTIDEIVHGAVLGKREIVSQIDSWCAFGFVEQLLAPLLDRGFQGLVQGGVLRSVIEQMRAHEAWQERRSGVPLEVLIIPVTPRCPMLPPRLSPPGAPRRHHCR